MFGLNLLAVRLPMAILGCISLFIMYFLLKKISNKKIALIGLAFFAICPWHIMKSRWGLESNLFPDIVLIFAYMMIMGIENKNKILYYLSFVVLGFSAYAYGTSYYFLPIFLIPLLIILVKNKKIDIKQAIFGILIVGIVALPIILYVIINTFDLPQINLPFVTVPKLKVNRYEEITSIFSSEFLKKSLSNFLSALRIFVIQYDGLPWNAIIFIGTIYLFSTFFTIIGIIDSFRKDNVVDVKYRSLFNIWFIVSIILTFICEPNINRINIIMIPIIYYTIIGIYLCSNKSKKIAISILILYIVSFGVFIFKYSKEDCDTYGTFASDLEEVIQYVENIEDNSKKVIVPEDVNYIYVLFYSKYNTKDFVDTVKYEDEYVEFRKVQSFGKYEFENIEYIKPGNVYIIRKSDLNKYDLSNCSIKEFKKYFVVECN